MIKQSKIKFSQCWSKLNFQECNLLKEKMSNFCWRQFDTSRKRKCSSKFAWNRVHFTCASVEICLTVFFTLKDRLLKKGFWYMKHLKLRSRYTGQKVYEKCMSNSRKRWEKLTASAASPGARYALPPHTSHQHLGCAGFRQSGEQEWSWMPPGKSRALCSAETLQRHLTNCRKHW